MTRTDLQRWLLHALDGARVRPPGASPTQPEPGDIRVVSGEGYARLALVLAVDQVDGTAQIVLAGSEPELITDSDLLFGADEISASFPVVVQTDLIGTVFLGQLASHAIGRIDADLAAVRTIALGADDPFQLVGRRGLPLQGERDPRWGLKEVEAEALHSIVRQCMAEFLRQEETRWVVDPGLFLAAAHGDLGVLGDLLEALRTKAVVPPITWIRLEDEGLLDDFFAHASLDLVNATSLMFADASQLGASLPPRRNTQPIEWNPRRRESAPGTVVLNELARDLARSDVTEAALLTSDLFWVDEADARSSPRIATCGSRQILFAR